MPDAGNEHDEERKSAETDSWAHYFEARSKRKDRRGLVQAILEARIPDQFDPLGQDIDRSMGAKP